MSHSVDQRKSRGHHAFKGSANSLSLSMGVAVDTVAAASGTKWQISTVCPTKEDQGWMMTLTLDWL